MRFVGFDKSLLTLAKFCRRNNIKTEKELKDALIVGGYTYWHQICFGNPNFVACVLAFANREE